MTTVADRPLVRHLVERVMGGGLRHVGGGLIVRFSDGYHRCIEGYSTFHFWLPLDSWADAGMIWQKIQKDPALCESVSDRLEETAIEAGCHEGREPLWWVVSKLTPRIFCRAVALSTGWKEPT